MGEFGIRVETHGIDWATAVGRKDRLVKSYLAKKGEALEERGVTWLREPVRFLDPQTLQADSRRLTARKVIVATGSKPNRPPIPGIEHTLDSSDILGLAEIPRRLVVIGGGVIAIEFASIFGHVGSQVTVLEALPAILKGLDDDVRQAIEQAASGWNVAIHTGVRVTSITRGNGAMSVTAEISGQSRRFDADVVLLATGRGPRVDGLDLDKVGARVDKKGVAVNEFLESDARGIYAVGDVHGRYQLSPVADYEGKLAAQNAVQGNRHKVDYRVIPQTIFTIPSASSVGLTEAEAREQDVEYAVSTLPFNKIGPAVIVGESEGFVKVIFDKRSGELIGGHIFGAESEELIHEIALAMQCRMTRDQILKAVPIHPSLSEAFFGAVTSAKTGHEESCCG